MRRIPVTLCAGIVLKCHRAYFLYHRSQGLAPINMIILNDTYFLLSVLYER